MSSQLSGTCQSAQLAKDYCEYEPIYIVDSLSATIGTQLLLREAIRLRDAGQSARQIAAQLDQLKSRIVVLAAVDTLEFLVKGGRLSKAAGFAGSLLGIHPMITLEEGKLSVLGKARGKKATLQLFWQQMEKLGMPDPQVEPIFGYTGNREAGQRPDRLLRRKSNRQFAGMRRRQRNRHAYRAGRQCNRLSASGRLLSVSLAVFFWYFDKQVKFAKVIE